MKRRYDASKHGRTDLRTWFGGRHCVDGGRGRGLMWTGGREAGLIDRAKSNLLVNLSFEGSANRIREETLLDCRNET